MEMIFRAGPHAANDGVCPTIQTGADEDLLSYEFLIALADRINLLGLSRLKTTDWLADTIYSWPGEILDGRGDQIEIYDEIFDDAYGRDSSFCWNSNVKQFCSRPRLRRTKRAMLLRMQLWDAALKIVGRPIELAIN